MPPAQGPTPSRHATKTKSTRNKSNRIKRKPIPLDPVALTFLTTNCRNRYEVEKHSGSNTLLDVEFFYGILESVKPVVFFALDTPVSGSFLNKKFFRKERLV